MTVIGSDLVVIKPPGTSYSVSLVWVWSARVRHRHREPLNRTQFVKHGCGWIGYVDVKRIRPGCHLAGHKKLVTESTGLVEYNVVVDVLKTSSQVMTWSWMS